MRSLWNSRIRDKTSPKTEAGRVTSLQFLGTFAGRGPKHVAHPKHRCSHILGGTAWSSLSTARGLAFACALAAVISSQKPVTMVGLALFERTVRSHNTDMERRGLQLSIRGMLALVACVAINIWCFRISGLLGLVAINVTKHVVIAQLCLALGVNRNPNDMPQSRGMRGTSESSPKPSISPTTQTG